MVRKKQRKVSEKSRKKVYAINLSVDNVNKLENKIGYNSRSKIVNELISDFVNKKKNLPLITRQISTEKTVQRKRG